LDPTIIEGAVERATGSTGYITPLGSFAVTAGVREVSVGIFPYRYNEIPPSETRTVRQIIQDLAAQTGFNSRPVACGSRTPGQFPVTF
jgi:hypothetical protein